MSNLFTERFKTITLVQLMDIVVNSHNYNEEALKAAEEELKNRNLSVAEIEEAKRIVIERTEQNNRKEEKRNKISKEYTGILDPRSEKSPDQILKLVCGGIAALLIYKIYTGYRFLIYTVQYSDYDNPFLYVWFMSAGLSFALIVLLWNKVKAGYFIFYGWLILNLAVTLINLYYLWTIFDILETIMAFNPTIINLVIFVSFFIAANNKKFKKAFEKKPKEEEIEEMIENIKRD